MKSGRRFGAICLVSSLLSIGAVNGADPVKLSVFFETLCSDSQRFVVNQMYPVWQDLKDIVTMDVNIYGKIIETVQDEGYTFRCQHGPEECHGNMMLTCAKNYLPEEQFLAFTNCVMETFLATKAEETCAEALGIDPTQIHNCWNSIEGQELLHSVGEVQRTLNPPLTYVPWILINDVYTDEQLAAAQEDLRTVICNAYTGEKPPQCN
ncbi:gamma-interferon-inducible lysosomal thiol reductase-like [Macrobrachium nipponense]|uniref:gamma-interferon-inducible lysosomal thiol reductase-like n=1 Tax=Macrobrachium nipponense TaxID=159736 RepID=UPI0030C87C45